MGRAGAGDLFDGQRKLLMENLVYFLETDIVPASLVN